MVQERCSRDLDQPRYTGYQVWNCQRTDEVLLDAENVALGHTSKMRWNQADKWVFSEHAARPKIHRQRRFRTRPVKKVAAPAEIRTATAQHQMTPDDVTAIVAALGDLARVVHDADPADKAEIYTQLGLTLACEEAALALMSRWART